MKRAVSVALLAAFACSCGRQVAIVVGSKNFTEQIILGEIAAQQLERKLHVSVKRRLDLGGTLLAHEALVKGDIDLYPEYTGTASSAVLKHKISEDPGPAYARVKDEYRERFHLLWLPPLGFNDTFAMVVRKTDIGRLRAPTLSAAATRPWRLGVGYEFLTRPDGLERLNQVYSLHWQGSAKTMDLGLLYRALTQNKVDMAAGNSTDGVLTDPKFQVLSDDKKAFPPYTACYVIREKAVEQNAAVKWALLMLSGHITDQAMRELNRRVDLEHQPVVTVARDFLAGQP